LDKEIEEADKQGGWIVDNSASGKIHQWMLWSTLQERTKDKADEALKTQAKLT
jgi:hypothetical protein